MNNKMIKGSVAGATGIVLLMGGFGTYALWSDEATLGGSSVTSGELDIAEGAVVWDDLSEDGTGDWNPSGDNQDLMVPGDIVTRTQTFAIKGTGKNLEGTIDFALGTGGISNPASAMTVNVDVTSDDTLVTETASGSNNFVFASPFDTATLTAVVTYTLPAGTGTQVDQKKTVSVPESKFTIAQTS